MCVVLLFFNSALSVQ